MVRAVLEPKVNHVASISDQWQKFDRHWSVGSVLGIDQGVLFMQLSIGNEITEHRQRHRFAEVNSLTVHNVLHSCCSTKSVGKHSKRGLLTILASYAAEIAKICIFWTFGPLIKLISTEHHTIIWICPSVCLSANYSTVYGSQPKQCLDHHTIRW